MLAVIAATAQIQPKSADVVLILPFENKSEKTEFNWVGESLAMALSDLLKVPGLNVVSNSERKIAQQRLRIPLSSIPSLATSLKLSQDVKATLLVLGSYTITPAQDETAATLNITARIIRVQEGRFLSESTPDGRLITRDIALNDALGNLQTMQGQIAYQILYQRDKALPYSQNDLIVAATKIPARAFEAYIKGLLTPAGEMRENFFKNALKLYSDAEPGQTYSEAALELGHLYRNENRPNDAIEYFERVISESRHCAERARSENRTAGCGDEAFAEASFYIGLIHWQKGNFESALEVLRPLADELKLTSIYNILGAIAVQAARAEKKDKNRAAALLNEGVQMLSRASESSSDDFRIVFNYGLALFLSENFVEAAAKLRDVIEENPRDGEAYFLLSKVLAELKDPGAGDIDNQARSFLASGNRYASLESDWARDHQISGIPPRVDQPQRRDFISVVFSRRMTENVRPAVNEAEGLIAKARDAYAKGNDDEAMALVRRVLVSEPMNAESYVILGKIHLRRGDRDPAASAFKTAIFWDNGQIDAHIALGRIYLERGDCLQVKTFAASALEIDANNQEAISLKRQSERCSK